MLAQGGLDVVAQCKLVGKAQEACADLPIEQSLNFDILKAAMFRAYELVLEAYRQKFRALSKTASQTYVEFARGKTILSVKWCVVTKATTLNQLRELILMEDINGLPDKVVVHLKEQKVLTLMLLFS